MKKRITIILALVLFVIFSGIIIGKNLLAYQNKDERTKISEKKTEEYIDEISNKKSYEYANKQDKVQIVEDKSKE